MHQIILIKKGKWSIAFRMGIKKENHVKLIEDLTINIESARYFKMTVSNLNEVSSNYTNRTNLF